MFCYKCGDENVDDASFCKKCGTAISPAAVSTQTQPAAPSPQQRTPGMDLLLPMRVSGLAFVAGYLGLASVLVIPAPLAILFGILALGDVERNPEKTGKGRAIFALIMGGLGLFFGVMIAISWLN
jgi:hypothetical protein